MLDHKIYFKCFENCSEMSHPSLPQLFQFHSCKATTQKEQGDSSKPEAFKASVTLRHLKNNNKKTQMFYIF